MKVMSLERYVLSISAIGALLAACGGSQPPISEPLVYNNGAALSRVVQQSSSSTDDLLYVAGGTTDEVYVLSYPTGKLKQTLTGFQYPSGECTDSSGDVFITNLGESGVIDEYAHGGTTPINVLQGANTGAGCSVDPATGNVAAPSGNDSVAVWANGRGAPTLYANPGIAMSYCGYDSRGNLFVNGKTSGSFALSELPSGGSAFTQIKVKASIGSPGQLQWVGKYLTVQDKSDSGTMYRFKVSGTTAQLVDSVHLGGIPKGVATSWIEGKAIIVPFATRAGGAKRIGYWGYPQGGQPRKVLQKFDFSRIFQAVTVSIGPIRKSEERKQ